MLDTHTLLLLALCFFSGWMCHAAKEVLGWF